MKYLLIVSSFLLATNLSAQKATTRVVVCLYERLDFNTDFPISEIGDINKIDELLVYDSLRSLLGGQLAEFSSQEVVFEVLTPNESYYFEQKGLKKEMSNPSRKGIDLNSISDREFWVFMNNHQADYLLFVNYYQIDKFRVDDEQMEILKRTIPSFYLVSALSERKAPKYSEHLIDFDVFDVNKQRILSFGNFGIPILKFKPETMALKGLDFYTIKKTYRNLAKKLWEELTLAIEEQRAIRK